MFGCRDLEQEESLVELALEGGQAGSFCLVLSIWLAETVYINHQLPRASCRIGHM